MIQSLESLSQCFMPKLKIILIRTFHTNRKEGNEIISIEPLKRCNFPEL